jgi:hypothetical protein
MNLLQIESRLASDHKTRSQLQEALGRASFDLVDGTLKSIVICFREMTRIDHAGLHAEATQLENACFEMASVLLQHFDACGLTTALGRASVHAHDFSLVVNTSSMVFDHMFLVERMAIPNNKVVSFWKMADRRRQQTIDMMSKSGFKLQSMLLHKRKVADELTPEWAHLSRIWVGIAGVCLIGANVLAEIFTAGIATPLLVASGLAGGAGIADGILDS